MGRWLADVEDRYGGVDAILLWPTYPNIGLAARASSSPATAGGNLVAIAHVRDVPRNLGADSRNQFDLIRGMPGGVAALKAAVAELRAAGVSVLLPYNPWDKSTRRSDEDDPMAMARLAREVGADGFNGGNQLPLFAASAASAISTQTSRSVWRPAARCAAR